MKPIRSQSSSIRPVAIVLLLLAGGAGLYLIAAPVPAGKPSAYPRWWFQREVVPRTDPANATPTHPADYPPAADFAVLNQGQLKQLAAAAFDEMQAHLPGGADVAVTELMKGWFVFNDNGSYQLDANGKRALRVTAQTSDFSPVTHGQLKAVAQVFFDRLKAELYYPSEKPYPWAAAGAQPAADYAAVNLGQAKNLFNFDLTADADGDAIPDWWEKAHDLNPAINPNIAQQISAGGGVSNYTCYLYGLDPNAAHPPSMVAMAAAAAKARRAGVPPVKISGIQAVLDLDAAAPLDAGPANLIVNGDFEANAEDHSTNVVSPGVVSHRGAHRGDATGQVHISSGNLNLALLRKWYVGGIPGWIAVGGEKADPMEPDTRANFLQVELQQAIPDYTIQAGPRAGKLNQYAELDAHWERMNDDSTPIRDNHGNNPAKNGRVDWATQPDHGIQQTVLLARGDYQLYFDYRGREGTNTNWFFVSAQGTGAQDSPRLLIPYKYSYKASQPWGDPIWKRASVTFTVSDGDPALTKIPVVLKFDLAHADSRGGTSYGTFIDNVILRPADVSAN